MTYVKAWDEIRQLYSEVDVAKVRGYKPSYFSFNVDGGRCEVCQGEGQVHIEMQFMADISLTCEACHGKRFKEEILDVKFGGQGCGRGAGHDGGRCARLLPSAHAGLSSLQPHREQTATASRRPAWAM